MGGIVGVGGWKCGEGGGINLHSTYRPMSGRHSWSNGSSSTYIFVDKHLATSYSCFDMIGLGCTRVITAFVVIVYIGYTLYILWQSITNLLAS